MVERSALLILAMLLAGPALAETPPPAGPETRQCLTMRDIRSSRMTADHEYQVRSWNGWWRNTASCPIFQPDRAITTRTASDQLCRNDTVIVTLPSIGAEYGGCVLGAWQRMEAPGRPGPKAGGKTPVPQGR